MMRSKRERAAAWIGQHPDLFVLAGLALLALALMAPYWSRPAHLVWPRSGLGTDFLHYRWVHLYHFRRALARYGEVPLWRGGSLGGEPLAGNPAVTLFYPLQFIVALLPISISSSFALQTAFHLWIAGLGTYVLLRRAIGLRRMASSIGALALMFTPRLSSNAVADVGLDYAMCWMPLCLAWAKLAIDRVEWGWAILAGAGLAMQFLLHVHIFFYTACTIGAYWGYRTVGTALLAWQSRQWGAHARRWLGQLGRLGWMVVVCSGLAAFELLPFVAYLPHLSREAMTLADANHYALPPAVLLSVGMPSPLKFPEWELYVGVLPLSLSPFALWHPRRDETRFWIALALFAVFFSLGTATPLFALMFRWVPGFRWLRVPARMWYLGAIAAAVCTGMAVDVLAQPSTRARWGRRWDKYLLFGGWGLALFTIVGRWVTRRPGEWDWLLGFAGGAGLALGLTGVALWMHNRIGYVALGQMLIGALLLDLGPVDAAYMEPRAMERLFETPTIGRHLLTELSGTQAALWPRVYMVRGQVPYHVAEREGMELVNGISSFQFKSYIQFIKRASGCTLSGFAALVPPCLSNEISATAYREARPDPVLLGLFNVGYVVTPLPLDGPQWTLRATAEGQYLYENEAVLPRAFGVGRVEPVASDALWDRLAEIDVRQAALVEAGTLKGPLSRDHFYAPAAIVAHEPNQIHVRVDMPAAGMLVIGEVWTPGWRATDNGAPAPVLKVNGTMRGVPLGAGVHDVVLRFALPPLRWGLAISSSMALLCVTLLIVRAKRARGI